MNQIQQPEVTPSAPSSAAVAATALSDSTEIVEHILVLFGQSMDLLARGEQVKGLALFAQAISDMEQFVQFFKHLGRLSAVGATGPSAAFQQQLKACVTDLHAALVAQDIPAIMEQVTSTLMPLLPQWPVVEQELAQGLARG